MNIILRGQQKLLQEDLFKVSLGVSKFILLLETYPPLLFDIHFDEYIFAKSLVYGRALPYTFEFVIQPSLPSRVTVSSTLTRVLNLKRLNFNNSISIVKLKETSTPKDV